MDKVDYCYMGGDCTIAYNRLLKAEKRLSEHVAKQEGALTLTLNFHRNAESINWDILLNDLVADDFHNGRSTEQLKQSFENTPVQAYASIGNRCVGTARALTDGVGNAYVVDVWTQSTYRRQGIARTLMEMLLEKLQGQHVYLQTSDAVAFYAGLGFEEQPTGMSLVVGEYLKS